MNIQIENALGQAIHAFQRGDNIVAENSLKRLLQVYPKNFPALQILGLICAAQERHEEACNYFKKAVKIDSNDGVLQYNLAKSLLMMGKNYDALPHHDKATRVQPNNYEAWLNYAKSLIALGRISDALEKLDKVLELKPDFIEVWANRGLLLHGLKRYAEAVESYERVLSFNPDSAEALSNLGLALAGLRAYPRALESYKKAVILKSDYADAYFNMALLLAEIKNVPEAIEAFRQALILLPDNPDVHHNFGQLLLANFNFIDGWSEYGWRFKSRSSNSSPLETNKILWDGRPRDNRLFIWAEQGIGDQILHASMLREMENYPQKVVVALNKKLIPIFRRSFPKFTFIDGAQKISPNDYDEHIPLGGLGQFFRKNIDEFKGVKIPYLVADEALVSDIKARIIFLGNTLPICGLSWGSINPEFGSAKTVTLGEFFPIINKNIKTINLQYGNVAAEIHAFQELYGRPINKVNGIDLFDDIDGLAAIIQTCDFVVTTSNTTAHIAGALGKETFLLVPYSVGKFWYWHDLNGASLWYPTIKIFQQTSQGGWREPIESIAECIGGKFE